MALKTYDAKAVSVVVGAQIITGFADDSKVSVERTDDAFTMTSGVDGDATRSKSNNKTGSITITLKQTSDSNDFLSSLADADELANNGVVPVIIKDNGGRTLYTAAEAWIRKRPVGEFGREAGDREWVLDCAALIMITGGN